MRALEGVLAEVPAFRDAARLEVDLLNGGLTNHTYRVSADGVPYALRLNGAQNSFIGLDPGEEAIAIAQGAGMGIAPRVVHAGSADDYLVTEFVQGHTLTDEEMHDPKVIGMIGQALAKVNTITGVRRVLSPYDIIFRQLDGARREGIGFPANLDTHLERVKAIKAKREADPTHAGVYCHNDAYHINMLYDGDRLVLIDWELSGVGDPYIDLGAIPYVANYPEAEERLLLHSYLGRDCTDEELGNLRDMRFVGLVREVAWALLQIGIQKNPVNHDFDFKWFVDHVMGRLDQGALSIW